MPPPPSGHMAVGTQLVVPGRRGLLGTDLFACKGVSTSLGAELDGNHQNGARGWDGRALGSQAGAGRLQSRDEQDLAATLAVAGRAWESLFHQLPAHGMR